MDEHRDAKEESNGNRRSFIRSVEPQAPINYYSISNLITTAAWYHIPYLPFSIDKGFDKQIDILSALGLLSVIDRVENSILQT
jgi:hypothetical protein